MNGPARTRKRQAQKRNQDYEQEEIPRRPREAEGCETEGHCRATGRARRAHEGQEGYPNLDSTWTPVATLLAD